MNLTDPEEIEWQSERPNPPICQNCHKLATEIYDEPLHVLHFHDWWDEWLCDKCFDWCCMEQ